MGRSLGSGSTTSGRASMSKGLRKYDACGMHLSMCITIIRAVVIKLL